MAVRWEIDDAIGVVLLGRPGHRTRWSPELETAYFDALAEGAEDARVRAIVVAGAGGDFCAGVEPGALDADATRDPRGDAFPTQIPKPVIAAVEGHCLGIGLAMALMCDIRVMAGGARLNTGLAPVGLVAEHGIAWLLQRTAGVATALDLLLSAREIDGTEGHRLGLATAVVPDGEAVTAAKDYARQLAERSSPLSMAAVKRQVHLDATADLDTAIVRGETWVRRAARSRDFEEGATALAERRLPHHPPLDPEVLAEVTR